MWDGTLAKFDKRISPDCLDMLRDTRWVLSMKKILKQSLRRGESFRESTPEGQTAAGTGAALTWTRIRRCAASCCLAGSGAEFCICLGPLSRSRRAARRSASSCFRLWPGPTPKLMSERAERNEDEEVRGRRTMQTEENAGEKKTA